MIDTAADRRQLSGEVRAIHAVRSHHGLDERIVKQRLQGDVIAENSHVVTLHPSESLTMIALGVTCK